MPLTQILGRHTAILQLICGEQLLLARLGDRREIGAQIRIYIRFSWLGIYLLIKIGGKQRPPFTVWRVNCALQRYDGLGEQIYLLLLLISRSGQCLLLTGSALLENADLQAHFRYLEAEAGAKRVGRVE